MYTAATWDSQPPLLLLVFCSQQKLGLPELKVSFLSLSVGLAAAQRSHAVGFAFSPELWRGMLLGWGVPGAKLPLWGRSLYWNGEILGKRESSQKPCILAGIPWS